MKYPLLLIAALSACSPALELTMTDNNNETDEISFLHDDPVDDVDIDIVTVSNPRNNRKNCSAKGRVKAEPNGKAFDRCDDG